MRWAAATSAGDQAAIAGPGPGYDPDPAAEWFLIAGDESSIPAIGTIIEAHPHGVAADVVLEVESEQDEQPLPDRAHVTTHWLHRDGRPAGRPLDECVRGTALPSGSGRVWVAGEAAFIRGSDATSSPNGTSPPST